MDNQLDYEEQEGIIKSQNECECCGGLLPEGHYAIARNELLEGALIEVRRIFIDFFANRNWGEVSIRFQNGAVLAIDEKRTKKII